MQRLVKECGMTEDELILVLSKRDLTDPSPRYTVQAKKLELFLHATGLGFGTADSNEVVKASYGGHLNANFCVLVTRRHGRHS